MVSSPSYHRSQNDSLISKRTIRVITCCIAEQMSVSRRIGKIVFTIIFMHPRSFEETAFRIPCCQWLTVFIQNYHCTGFFGKLHHVFTQTSNTRRDCLLLSFRKKWQIPRLYYYGNVEVVHPTIHRNIYNSYHLRHPIQPDRCCNFLSSD